MSSKAIRGFYTLKMFRKCLVAFRLGSFSRSAGQTLCLYHNWSQHEHIYKGPVDTDLWNLSINSERRIVEFGHFDFLSSTCLASV